ncbi:MAG TPA: CCA tRNA nucleotidyltransferase [Anaerolineae bacterium]|nr:CCA tRNA nucleotidyltransferase [Anaerolineae bacterium]HID84609.1 CCA tRNA nucleotidyltransferase [Anaerolineales bacterium]HIQ08412.1 CCA tRNA nucleotidyltransferase [Anaerolineaceae bacterium]
MTLPYLPPLPDFVHRVTQLAPPDQPIYLVGGAVRDWLRHRPVHDWDFAIPQGAVSFARRVARTLKGAFVLLDEKHGVARVILPAPSAPEHPAAQRRRTVLDFTDFRGPTLEDDLRLRDFTLNAMALNLRHPQRLLDPLGGLQDLKNGLLRACHPDAFQNDPIRIWRGVRLAAAYGWRIEPSTREAMRRAAASLRRVSAERQRDELFRILSGPGSVKAVKALQALDALAPVLPELPPLQGVPQSLPHREDVWTHTLQVLERLNRLLEALAPTYDEDKAADFALGLTVLRIGRYRILLAEHLNNDPHSKRSLVALLRLAALYHDTGKPTTARQNGDGQWRFPHHAEVSAALARQRGKSLALSNAEVQRLVHIVRHHGLPYRFTRAGGPPDRRQIYRYFRATGPAGVEVALLSLADVQAMYGPYLSHDLWERHLATIRALLEAWWEYHRDIVAPPPLLDGHALMQALHLRPSPLVGELLERLREAQAAGEIRTAEEALQQVRQWLREKQSPSAGA